MPFLLDVFLMTVIALVSVINHYDINGLHVCVCVYKINLNRESEFSY